MFGHAPGSRESGVPGSRVGYMPQELALFGEFNIGNLGKPKKSNFFGCAIRRDGGLKGRPLREK